MDKRDQELLKMATDLEVRESGVAEIAALYESIESIYIQASLTLHEDIPVATVASTNPPR